MTTLPLHTTLAGAKAKAERGIAFLQIPSPTAEHMKSAVECFKSAAALAASHRTVLKELEDQLPAPGEPLFTGDGAPAPDADLTPSAPRAFTPRPPMTNEEIEAFRGLKWDEREEADADLLFEFRTTIIALGLQEEWPRFREMFDQLIAGEDEGYIWLSNAIRSGGPFDWPFACIDCGKDSEAPEEGKDVLCHRCEWARKMKEEEEKRAQKEAKKAEKAAKTAARASKKNPLVTETPSPEEGGDE